MGHKVLLTGSTGLFGLAFMKGAPAGHDIYAGYYDFPKAELPDMGAVKYIEFDIRMAGQVFDVFDEVSPDVVVHAASIGNVDYCERNRDQARQVNVTGSRNMIEASKRRNPFFIFLSSNAVFDGKKPPYAEDDRPNPIDYYGGTKLQTEQDLSLSGLRYSVVRLMTMYGWHHPRERQNPVTWILQNLKQRQGIKVVDDIYNNHLYAADAAAAVWAIITKNKQGAYHVAGAETVSRYELAREVADTFGLDKQLISPVKSSFFPSIAPRPKNTSFKIDKMRSELPVCPAGIREGLALMKNNPPREWKYDWQG